MSDPGDAGIDVLLREQRTFPPSRAYPIVVDELNQRADEALARPT